MILILGNGPKPNRTGFRTYKSRKNSGTRNLIEIELIIWVPRVDFSKIKSKNNLQNAK